MRLDAKLFKAGANVRRLLIRTGLLSAVALGLFGLTTSCIYEYGADEAETDEETSPVSLSIKLMSTGTVKGTEVGSKYENYLDIEGGDYEIYFFTNEATDGNDTYIARFYPDAIEESSDNGDYTWYSMTGQVPRSLLDYPNFKIMILANWGRGNYPTLSSTTTIDDVCTSAEWGTYSYKTDFELAEDNLIPFYGIQEYENIEFTLGETTELEDPINMLRAMAKIEVVLANSDIDLESVVLHNYNETGYCAPAGVYSSDDYVYESSGDWYYIEDGLDVHLYGDANDTAGKELNFSVTTNDDGQIVWYCYAPEYANMDGDSYASDYAYIQLNLSGYADNENEELDTDLENFRIYFRNYGESGTTTAGADYDIGRNVIYRFTVSFTENWLLVHVDKWEDSFHNDFVFGEGDDDDEGEDEGND